MDDNTALLFNDLQLMNAFINFIYKYIYISAHASSMMTLFSLMSAFNDPELCSSPTLPPENMLGQLRDIIYPAFPGSPQLLRGT